MLLLGEHENYVLCFLHIVNLLIYSFIRDLFDISHVQGPVKAPRKIQKYTKPKTNNP